MLCEIKIDGEQTKIQVRGIQPISKIVEGSRLLGFRIFIESSEAVSLLASRLNSCSSGGEQQRVSVKVVVVDRSLPGDVEISLAKSYGLTPEIVQAIKQIKGVVHIEKLGLEKNHF